MKGAIFISFNSRNRTQAVALAERLRAAGETVWLDSWQAGNTLQALAEALTSASSTLSGAIILLGDRGLGGWQSFEARMFVKVYAEQAFPLVVASLHEIAVSSTIPRYLKPLPTILCDASWSDRTIADLQRALCAAVPAEDRALVSRILEGEEGRTSIGLGADELEVEFIMKLHRLGRYEEAVGLFDEIVEKARSELGARDPKISFYLNEKGLALRELGRFREAETAFREAVQIDLRNVGIEHPVTISRINNLALALWDLGRFREAESQYRRVAEIEEKRDANGPGLATCLSNLSLVLKDMGKFESSEQLLSRALTIDREAFGPEHPSVARDLANLSSVLHRLNRLPEAEELCKRAIAIDTKCFGEKHPLVASTLNKSGRAA